MSVGQSATPLGKVRGLGSAGEGGEHWLAERVTSAALLLLGAWLFAEVPTPWIWIGAPIIIASGLVIVWREHLLHRQAALSAEAATPS